MPAKEIFNLSILSPNRPRFKSYFISPNPSKKALNAWISLMKINCADYDFPSKFFFKKTGHFYYFNQLRKVISLTVQFC